MTQYRSYCQELIEKLYDRVKKCFSNYPQHEAPREEKRFEEHYKMEREIFTWMILEIIQCGDYTIEGIARYTGLPLELISDAAMGLQVNISMTLWMCVADFYLEAKGRICVLEHDE